MKDVFGWIALTVFGAACWFIGANRFLMKSLNATVLGMLALSIVLVLLLERKRK